MRRGKAPPRLRRLAFYQVAAQKMVVMVVVCVGEGGTAGAEGKVSCRAAQLAPLDVVVVQHNSGIGWPLLRLLSSLHPFPVAPPHKLGK